MKDHEQPSEAQPATPPSHDEVAKRAYALSLEEGRPQGSAEENWLAAEAQLRHPGSGHTVHPENPEHQGSCPHGGGLLVRRLAQADIGIAIGAGSEVAVETADVILVRSNPLDVVAIVQLSRATYRKMVQNLVWATDYNVVAVPLAAVTEEMTRVACLTDARPVPCLAGKYFE